MLGKTLTGLLAFALLSGGSAIDRAGADTPTQHMIITVGSDLEDFPGHGTGLVADSRFDSVAGGADLTEIQADAGSWQFRFWPVYGQRFAVGSYGASTGIAFGSSSTVPAINISNDGRSCDTAENSSFQILDLASTGDRIDRLDLVFVQHCNGYTPASFGEIRVNEPGTTVSAQGLQWPDTEPGQSAASLPVLIRNTTAGNASVGTPTISTGAFSVADDNCPAVLAAGMTCRLDLRFMPSARGQFTAVARLPFNGDLNSISLAGSTGSGTSAVHIDGFVDPVNQAGGYYLFTSANANIRFNGDGNRISVGLYATNGPWFVDITPAEGTTLSPGTYSTQRYATATKLGLDVYGQGRGCDQSTGTVTIRQLQLASGDHSMTHLDAVFSQQCTGETSTLRGEVEFESTAPASPPIGTSFAYAASSRHGSVVYLNGLVKQGELGGPLPRSPGRTVYLQRVLAGQWQTMLARTTDRNGALAIGFVQPVHFTYRWIVIGNSRFTGGQSATTTP